MSELDRPSGLSTLNFRKSQKARARVGETHQINGPSPPTGPSIEQAEAGKMGGMRHGPRLHPLPYPARTRTVLDGAYLPSYRLIQSIEP